MSKQVLLTLNHSADEKTEFLVLKKGELMPSTYSHERGFVGPSLVVRRIGVCGVTSTEYDVDDVRVWEWLGNLASSGIEAERDKIAKSA